MDAKSEAVMKSDSSSSSKSLVQAETSSSSVRVSKKSISSKEIVATQLLSGTYKTFADGIGSNGNESLQLEKPSVVSFPNVTTLDGHMSDVLLAGHRSLSLSSAVRQSASTVSNKQEDVKQNIESEVALTEKLATTELSVQSQNLGITVAVAKVDDISSEGDDETEIKSIEIEKVVNVRENVVEETNSKKLIKRSEAEESANEVDNDKAESEKQSTAPVVTEAPIGDVLDIESTKSTKKSTVNTHDAPIINTTLPIPSITDVPNPIANDTEETKNKVVQEGEEFEDSEDDGEEDEESEVEEQSQNTVSSNVTSKVKEVVKDQVDKSEAPVTITKQVEFNNQIKDIISDIDSNIIEQEKIAQLKHQELELIKKQQELAKQIEQQQLLANQLEAQNQLKQQEFQQQQFQSPVKQQTEQQYAHQPNNESLLQSQPKPKQQQQLYSQSQSQPRTNSSKYETFEETQNENGYTRKSEIFKAEESSNVSKTIDLRKIFTPATDAVEILPKNRKLYASSAFYSPSLHPTVEDQVELARRISHSLSDISNQTSKGQSMYVNRKKRSVKWVHEGSGQANIGQNCELEEDAEASKENHDEDSQINRATLDKLPLKLVMNPRGQMRDYNSVSESMNIETGLLSPNNCAELILALQLQKGRGAELFAKRRRKAENWVVDETNAGTQSPSGIPDFQQYQPKPSVSPSVLPAYSDAGKHRVQLNIHQEQMIEKYAKPGLKVVKSPWEAALETGSASTAFVESQKPHSHTPTPVVALSPAPAPQYCTSPSSFGSNLHGYASPYGYTKTTTTHQTPPSLKHELPSQYQQHILSPVNPQRDLAYKPNIPQGWRAPNVELPKGYQTSQFHDFDGFIECEPFKNIQYLTSDHSTESSTLEYSQQKSCYDSKDLSGIRNGRALAACIPLQHKDYVISYNDINEKFNSNRNSNAQLQHFELMEESIDGHGSSKKKIDVQKQLQYFEEHQRRVVQQQLSERIFLERREKERLLHKQRQDKSKQKISSVGCKCLKKQTDTDLVAETIKKKLQEVTECIEKVVEYVKVPVRDLIYSFEQQSLDQVEQGMLQARKNQSSSLESTCQPYLDRHLEMENFKCKNDTNTLICSNEGLYVPKEIPLDSYAPPPICSPIQSQNIQNYSPVVHKHQSNQTLSTPAAPRATFPQGAALPSVLTSFDCSKTGGFPFSRPVKLENYSSAAPPKQQLYAPTSYQKVVTNTINNAPPVNFNPSPIPYEKLSKFENHSPSSRDNGIYSLQRHLNVRGSSKVRNVSPTPFSGARSPVSYRMLHSQTSSPRPLSQQFSSNHDFGFDTGAQSQNFISSNYRDIGQPSFNKTARGWGGVGAEQNERSCSANAADFGALPYSDF